MKAGPEVGEEASPSDWEGRARVCFLNPCGRLDDLEELVKIQILRPPPQIWIEWVWGPGGSPQ